MKKVFSSLIIVLVLFIGVCFGINVNAASGTIKNVVTCPGEDMATQMQINWQSSTSLTDLKVEYTVASDTAYANSTIVDGTYRSFMREKNDPVQGASYIGFNTPRHIWNALLQNLTPKTKYIYRITDGTTVYSKADYAFETGSVTNDQFSFLFITDPQYDTDSQAQKFNLISETHIQNDDVKFAFITGDICDKGGNSNYWDLFYTKSSLKKIPYATTVGNHEYYDQGTTTTDNVIYNQYFFNPQNGSENVKGSSYYFVYNQALFIMIDSEDRKYEEQQKQWFIDVCNSVDCNYIIVGAHRSAFPGGPYVDAGKTFYSKWGYIFDQCNVDLVLSGHDHLYARTKSIYNNEVTTEDYKGTVYIEGGSSGTKYYNKQSDENAEKWACQFERVTCGTVITVGENNLLIKTYAIGTSGNGGYVPGEVKDIASIPRKRFGTVAETFNKEEFEKSITIESAMPDMTSGSVKWNENGYGYVHSVTCTNLNSNKVLGSTPFINNLATKLEIKGGFWIGEVNKIKVDIVYKDGTKSTLELDYDNTIDWGEIKSARPIDITTTNFKVVLTVAFKKDVDYIDKIRILNEEGKLVKNYFVKEDDLSSAEVIIDGLSQRLMEPNTTKKFTVEAMNVNGTVIWTDEFEVTTLRELTEEDIYQNDMANIAFQMLIENLLAALGK